MINDQWSHRVMLHSQRSVWFSSSHRWSFSSDLVHVRVQPTIKLQISPKLSTGLSESRRNWRENKYFYFRFNLSNLANFMKTWAQYGHSRFLHSRKSKYNLIPWHTHAHTYAKYDRSTQMKMDVKDRSYLITSERNKYNYRNGSPLSCMNRNWQ